jgi:transposase
MLLVVSCEVIGEELSIERSNGLNRWHGDHDTRRAVYSNRIRLGSGKASGSAKRRTELAERSFQHTLGRGGMRKTWLRGREKCEEAIPAARRRLQSRPAHEENDRIRHPERDSRRPGHLFIGFWAKSGWMLFVFTVHQERPDVFVPIAAVTMRMR